ncbi:MAG: alpha/beta hydrolase [Phycisphaerae bacterium]|nr:alpha/beta hydrolase [Gemmatimonadaceae bacterium]
MVRARMRPHAHKPIDPLFIRENMGRPKGARELMLRATGSVARRVDAGPDHPPGDWVTAREATDSSPVMLYLHGGGFIGCSPETHRPLVGSLCKRLKARAFVPAYRLAPEFPYPAALDDAMQSYRHLIHTLQIDSRRIILAGDSAGGGLALSTAMRIRDEGLPQPAVIIAYSPWTDLAASGSSLDENSDRCAMFAGVTIRRAAPFYLGNTAAQDPGPSPLYGDFRGLAPLLIHASSDEVLRDDSVRVAERASAAGVKVEIQLWRRVPHVWQFFPAILPEAEESLQLTMQFVQQHLSHE